MTTSQPLEYIPFQERPKCIIYKILNYGKLYFNYSTYNIANNTDNIERIYIDNEPCLTSEHLVSEADTLPEPIASRPEDKKSVEIHYKAGTHDPAFRTCQLTNKEISQLLGFYGCKV